MLDCEMWKEGWKKKDCPSHHPVVLTLIQHLVLVFQKALMLQTPHILFYSLSAGKPEELSSLILSLESTCRDLFATGYFESDISDDLLTSADGEMLLQ